LEKGELQVSQKEREELLSQTVKDITNLIANMCLNPNTNKPYTFGVLERTIKDNQISFKTNKNAKVQALETIQKLKKIIPIERAKMRLNITLQKDKIKKLKNDLKDKEVSYEKEVFEENNMNIVMLVDPGLYRTIDDYITENKGKIDVLDTCVQELGDEKMEDDDDEEDKKDNKKKKEEIKKDEKKLDDKKDKSDEEIEEEELSKKKEEEKTNIGKN